MDACPKCGSGDYNLCYLAAAYTAHVGGVGVDTDSNRISETYALQCMDCEQFTVVEGAEGIIRGAMEKMIKEVGEL